MALMPAPETTATRNKRFVKTSELQGELCSADMPEPEPETEVRSDIKELQEADELNKAANRSKKSNSQSHERKGANANGHGHNKEPAETVRVTAEIIEGEEKRAEEVEEEGTDDREQDGVSQWEQTEAEEEQLCESLQTLLDYSKQQRRVQAAEDTDAGAGAADTADE